MTAATEQNTLPATNAAQVVAAKKQSAVEAAEAIVGALPFRVHMKAEEPNEAGITNIGPGDGLEKEYGALLQAALGSASHDFIVSAAQRIFNAVGQSQTDLNAALALISAIAPRDEYECSLAVTIATAHAAGQRLMVRSLSNSTYQGVQTFGNLATKFQRTELAARDTLAKHRTGGVQTVKHVHVNEGGQAIVADTVTYGGGANGK